MLSSQLMDEETQKFAVEDLAVHNEEDIIDRLCDQIPSE